MKETIQFKLTQSQNRLNGDLVHSECGKHHFDICFTRFCLAFFALEQHGEQLRQPFFRNNTHVVNVFAGHDACFLTISVNPVQAAIEIATSNRVLFGLCVKVNCNCIHTNLSGPIGTRLKNKLNYNTSHNARQDIRCVKYCKLLFLRNSTHLTFGFELCSGVHRLSPAATDSKNLSGVLRPTRH